MGLGNAYCTKYHVYCGRVWAVILSWAVWNKSWAGCDPAQSKISTYTSIATTGIAAQAQLLTA